MGKGNSGFESFSSVTFATSATYVLPNSSFAMIPFTCEKKYRFDSENT
jgi:hypothetical protein